MSLTTNPSLLGQINLSGSDVALMLKMYSGQVLTTFEAQNKFEGLIQNYQVGAGKSFQFPAIGQSRAVYHVRGEDITDPAGNYLNNVEMAERTINIDRPLLSATWVDDWDTFVNHFQTRSDLAAEQGKALAKAKDRVILQMLVLAARSAATLTSTQSTTRMGTQIADAGMSSSASTFQTKVLQAMQTLVEKDVPMEDLVLAVRPAQYFAMVAQGDLIDFNFGGASNGGKPDAKIHKVYGFRVVLTNNLPNGVVNPTTGTRNDYSGDFTKTVAVAFHGSAVGTVRRMGVTSETEYQIPRQGTLMLSKFIEGHGILRPECAVELKTT